MEVLHISEITLSKPIIAIGKTFIGDYAKSQQYILELQNLLNRNSISYVANKVIGAYYDNPQEKKIDDLRSFQGVFLTDIDQALDPTLSRLSLTGKYLYVCVSGDPMKSIYDGYNALFKYIQQRGIILKSNTGYQVSTFENGSLTTEIYMERS